MTTSDLAQRLGLTPEQVKALTTVASRTGEGPAVLVTIEEVVRRLVRAALELDDGLRRRGLGGVGDWLIPEHDRSEAASSQTADWADGLDLHANEAAEFERVVVAMGLTPVTALQAMLAPRRMVVWPRNAEDWLPYNAYVGVRGLPLAIMPTEFMWPADEPFPWGEREALAAVLGYEVRWHGSFDDFLTKLRGKWEMGSGQRAVLWQS